MNKQISIIYFSPTGGTARITREIANGIGEVAAEYDLTRPAARKRHHKLAFGSDDIVVVGVPVYAGRVPRFLVEHFARFSGLDTQAVFVAVYGNRAYEDALRELKDTFERNGFIGIAAGAFIAEHSYTSLVATGRPDTDDLLTAMNFGLEINARLNAHLNDPEEIFNAPALAVKGNLPYIEKPPFPPTAPETDATCRQCGICARVCPMGAIDRNDATIVDAAKCIRCHACVQKCPTHAKHYTHAAVDRIRQSLIDNCSAVRREPEVFF